MKTLIYTSFPFFALVLTGCGDYESMYPKTKPGIVEVKTLPERTALESKSKGAYFDRDDDLFMGLFRYISRNEVAMTVPVEAEMKPSAMRFFVGKDAANDKLPSNQRVEVKRVPARQVLSMGIQGAYTKKNFEKAQAALQQWLKDHPKWKAAGEAYAVYWNGPYVPNGLKRSEAHIPVKPAG